MTLFAPVQCVIHDQLRTFCSMVGCAYDTAALLSYVCVHGAQIIIVLNGVALNTSCAFTGPTHGGIMAGPLPLTVFSTFILVKDNSHRYTHLILALGIVREPTVWGFITSKYIFGEK